MRGVNVRDDRMTAPLQRPERVRRARHRLRRAVVREGAVVDEPEHPIEVDVGQHAGRRRHAAPRLLRTAALLLLLPPRVVRVSELLLVRVSVRVRVSESYP